VAHINTYQDRVTNELSQNVAKIINSYTGEKWFVRYNGTGPPGQRSAKTKCIIALSQYYTASWVG